jgi:peptidoglycan/xylan/chitin deacetylase (PgdA/CDA1 family)
LRSVILAYHRVASLATDPQLLAVTPHRFDEQLAALRQAFDPIPLTDLVTSLRGGENPAGFVLTFDDGYNDNLHSAVPLLERHEVPATVFVATGYIGGSREFWWDELERILLMPVELPETLRLRIADRDHSWNLTDSARATALVNRSWSLHDHQDPTVRHVIYRALCSSLGRITAEDRESILEDLRRWAGLDRHPRPSHRPLTGDELLELAEDGLVHIGAHTAEHPVLAALPLSIQQKEVESSKRDLERMLGKTVAHFSYPFGRGRHPRQTYSRETVKLVEQAGYVSACAVKPAIHLRPGLCELPRLIVQDWDGDELLRRIRSPLPARLGAISRQLVPLG